MFKNYKILFSLIVPTAILIVIGIAIIQSAAINHSVDYATRQCIWAIIGICIAIAIAITPPKYFSNYAYIYFIISILALVLVLIIGEERNGTKAWLGISSLGIQPSEFAKIAVIIIFGRYLADFEEHRYDKKYFMIPFVGLSIPMILILLQPDLGTALTFIPIVLAMFFASGTRTSLIVTTISGMLMSFPFMWFLFFKQHHKQRIILTWFPERDPLGYGYQALQSNIAIGSGGFFGRGYMQNSLSRLGFLPEQHTDFIFAVIGEEFGFTGSTFVLLMFLWLIAGGYYVAICAGNIFGRTVAAGITTLIAVHVIMNVGMTISLLPIIGVPLPLVSYGGSSFIATMICVGMLLSIYGYSRIMKQSDQERKNQMFEVYT